MNDEILLNGFRFTYQFLKDCGVLHDLTPEQITELENFYLDWWNEKLNSVGGMKTVYPIMFKKLIDSKDQN